jgi:hypothetical protein
MHEHHFVCKKVSTSIPACLRMARSVPSGMSPGWFGIVVYRFRLGLNQISCEPAVWRWNSKPSAFNR